MSKHNPANCPQCGRFSGCQVHNCFYGEPYTYEYFCTHCRLYFMKFAKVTAYNNKHGLILNHKMAEAIDGIR